MGNLVVSYSFNQINSSHQLLIINFFTDWVGIKIYVFLRRLL